MQCSDVPPKHTKAQTLKPPLRGTGLSPPPITAIYRSWEKQICSIQFKLWYFSLKKMPHLGLVTHAIFPKLEQKPNWWQHVCCLCVEFPWSKVSKELYFLSFYVKNNLPCRSKHKNFQCKQTEFWVISTFYVLPYFYTNLFGKG